VSVAFRLSLEAVGDAEAAVEPCAALDIRARYRRIAEPALLRAEEQEPFRREGVAAPHAERGEKQPAVAHRIVVVEDLLVGPRRLSVESGGQAVAFVHADIDARVG